MKSNLWLRAAGTNGLAIALQEQGSRTSGEVGANLLAEATTAYDDALLIRTKVNHPVDWAMPQQNMAILERKIAKHESTVNPRPHLDSALNHIDSALKIFDPIHMTHDHKKAIDSRMKILAALLNTEPPFPLCRALVIENPSDKKARPA